MNYQQALEYIHSVSWKGSRPGLGRTEELLSKMGNPQDKLKFIHVAGTNGKGSFCAMLSSILEVRGYKVGLYTSPFIVRFNERMKINNLDIEDEQLALCTEYVKKYADQMTDTPTEFELITAIAMKYFAENECDYVVLECGMGGRLDSTNVVKTSVLSVITGIALDHVEFLGDSIEKIAFEKAGIIKPEVPVLWCGDDERAFAVINDRANELGCKLYTVNRDLVKIKNMDLCGSEIDFGEYKQMKISLLGLYQIANMCNVMRAVEVLNLAGCEIEDSHMREGFEKTRWKARFEIISQNPLIISDGGHNLQGILSFCESIRTYFGEEKVNVLMGVMRDKEYVEMVRELSLVAKKIYCITPHNDRALRAGELSETIKKNFENTVLDFEDIKQGVRRAVEDSVSDGSVLVSVGSLYMYSDVADEIEKIKNGIF